jgi:hypothetical protein
LWATGREVWQGPRSRSQAATGSQRDVF